MERLADARRERRKALTLPRPDETLIRALARAYRWNRMLEAGSLAELNQINVEMLERT